MATNSFQPVCKKCLSTWGLHLKNNNLVSTSAKHVVDIGEYLPESVKAQIHRKDGTRFVIEFAENL